MPEPVSPFPVSSDDRPWHGSENPFEALYQHFSAEIASLKAGAPDATVKSGDVVAGEGGSVNPPVDGGDLLSAPSGVVEPVAAGGVPS